MPGTFLLQLRITLLLPLPTASMPRPAGQTQIMLFMPVPATAGLTVIYCYLKMAAGPISSPLLQLRYLRQERTPYQTPGPTPPFVSAVVPVPPLVQSVIGLELERLYHLQQPTILSVSPLSRRDLLD